MNDLFEIGDILGVDCDQPLVQQYLVISGRNAGSQVAHRRLIGQTRNLGSPLCFIRL